MRVLVCGGRNFQDVTLLEETLAQYIYGPEDTLIAGKARGADTLAANYGRRQGAHVIEFPADWEQYGKSAGHIRNQQMLDEGKPDLVIAFRGGAGTKNMIERSLKAGVEVVVVE